MSRQDHTELICIIDRSGSMEVIRNDAIGGFNAFLSEQRKVQGTASVTLVLFDDRYEVPFENVDLSEVENLTDQTFVPRGRTALLDAIGRTINDVGSRLSSTQEDERPGKVLVCILTDGYENASREFRLSTIKEMIEHQRSKYNWEFSFIAANQDAFAEAAAYGIPQNYTHNFTSDRKGTRVAFARMSASARAFREEL